MLLESLISVKLPQNLNAAAPKVVTLSDIVTLVKTPQSLKASTPILVTLLGIVMLVILSQL